jgi:hypothetical protein
MIPKPLDSTSTPCGKNSLNCNHRRTTPHRQNLLQKFNGDRFVILACEAEVEDVASLQLAPGRVALAVTHQGSHRSGRAHISASGSSISRFAILVGPRSYPAE